MDASEPRLRPAVAADAVAIDALRRASIQAIFPAFYDARQTASSVAHVGRLDDTLIADGTYLVVEAEGDIVACGGWSRRDKLYAGSAAQEGRARLLDPSTEPARIRAMFVREDWARRGLGTRILEACEAAARREGYAALALMATLPGIPLYERFGFRIVARVTITLPDGVELPCAEMEKDLGRDRGPDPSAGATRRSWTPETKRHLRVTPSSRAISWTSSVGAVGIAPRASGVMVSPGPA